MRIVAVGEVMIELARDADGRLLQSLGGDTFNTSVYLARAGAKVSFATAIGTDPFSDSIIEMAKSEGVGTDLILRVNDRLPGLYMIEPNKEGEGSTFHYWRENSPARQLFELPGWDRVAKEIVAASHVYLSGITLSLYSNVGLGRLLAALEFSRERGAKIIFDTNWRPKSWRGDEQRARAVFSEALKRSDLVLPTFDDEARLWGDASPEATVERMTTFGVKEIVVKQGPKSALILSNGKTISVPAPEIIEPLDPTGAGDAFNGAFIAARLANLDPEKAALAGHAAAAEVLRHRGAIAPASKATAKPAKNRH
jgi:2-dehydro-3-deoxygluconokinase